MKPQSDAGRARLAERDDRRGRGLDAPVEEVLDRHDRLEMRADGMRREDVRNRRAPQRELIEVVVELLAEQWTHAQILSNYPQLTEDDIQAALHYAAEALKR